ncbi:protein OXIDATIVE STRESS 3-like [Pyrus communis]|uniref:protein OXIDATIVE STRESS 3-like n=1 Tax=Pyrus communis TaxID=23211 RepID=UPI0035BF1324
MGRREGEMRASGGQNREENHAHQVGKEFWVFNEEHEEVICDDSRSFESSSMENSMSSTESSSSSDLVEDASSSSSTSSSNGPLYELSDLMMHLPIKRGLSKCYEGKSQSFTTLASVTTLEDLAKRVAPCRKRIKACKSFGGGFDGDKSPYLSPKANISKKASRGGGSFLYSLSNRGKLLD